MLKVYRHYKTLLAGGKHNSVLKRRATHRILLFWRKGYDRSRGSLGSFAQKLRKNYYSFLQRLLWEGSSNEVTLLKTVHFVVAASYVKILDGPSRLPSGSVRNL